MNKVVLITGASSGFGRLAAKALAMAGHVVYGSMRQTATRNAPVVEQMANFSQDNHVDLRALELDVQSERSVDAAVGKVIAEQGRIDVLIHNAGHMVFGPAEAFTPEQFAELYDVNVLSTQRVNRAVLPHMRKRTQGLLVWVPAAVLRAGPALSCALLRCKGGDGCHRRAICARAVSSGHRDLDYRARRLHVRHQPLRQCKSTGRCRAGSQVRSGPPYNGFGEQVQKAFAAIVRPMPTPAPSPRRS